MEDCVDLNDFEISTRFDIDTTGLVCKLFWTLIRYADYLFFQGKIWSLLLDLAFSIWFYGYQNILFLIIKYHKNNFEITSRV